MSLLILYLLVFPGYCLLPADYPRRLRLPFVLFASVAVSSGVGLALLAAGLFSVPLLALLELPLLVVAMRRSAVPALHLRLHLLPLLLFAALVAFFTLTVGEPFDATGDAGVYTLTAAHIADQGRWDWSKAELVAKSLPESLVVRQVSYAHRWRELAPGLIVDGHKVRPQFLPLYPLWGAILSPWAGRAGPLWTNLLGALLLLLAMSSLCRLLVPRPGPAMAVVAVVASPVLLVFVRYPSAETFLAGLLMGWLLWTVLLLRRPAAVAAVLPAALLALAVTVKFFAWAVAGLALLYLIYLPRPRLYLIVVFALALIPAVAVDTWLAATHLVNHLLELSVLRSFGVVTVGCLLLLALRLLWPRLSGPAPVIAALAIAGVSLYLALVRPSPVEVGSQNNLLELVRLQGGAFFTLTLIGLIFYVLRRHKLWQALLPFVFVLISLYLLLGSGESPYYPFAARRYLPLTVPLAAFFVAFLLSRPRRMAGMVGVPLLFVALVPPLLGQRSAVTLANGAGFTATLDGLRDSLAGAQTTFALHQAWRYAPHLLAEGRPVYCLDLSDPLTLHALSRYLRAHPDTRFVTNHRRLEGVLARVEERRAMLATTRTPPLATGPERLLSFSVFRPTAQELRLGRRLDVGDGDDLRVGGCFGPERAGRRTFRWTTDRASFLVRGGSRVRFTWSKDGHPSKVLKVALLCGGMKVADARLKGGWQVSRWFEVPRSRGPMVLELEAPTFVPALVHGSGDHRRLAIKVDLVEVLK